MNPITYFAIAMAKPPAEVYLVPLDEIRKILGHIQTSTTLGYIFNPYNTEETEKRIENPLSIGFQR